MLSKLEQTFQSAFCTVDVPVGSPVVCSCGLEYLGPAKQGAVADQILVLGCVCPLASSFGGLFWRQRHEIANFLREMTLELDRENVRLRGELPPSLDAKTDLGSDTPEALRTCRDHWKTSYEHERANVIRLRNFVADSHMRGFALPPLQGIPCKCEDCELVRQHSASNGFNPE